MRGCSENNAVHLFLLKLHVRLVYVFTQPLRHEQGETQGVTLV